MESHDQDIGTVEDIADAMRRDRPKEGSIGLGRTVFLIGAGCSRAAGVPLAREIAQELTVRLAVNYGLVAQDCTSEKQAFASLVTARKYPGGLTLAGGDIDWGAVYDHIFAEHYSTPKEVQPLFAEFCDRAEGRINWANICIGELVRLGYISTIVTTNFDQLVLQGIAGAGRLPVVADGLDSLNRVAGEPSHPQLIQIHGSRHTYYLRNSAADLRKVAEDDGARHAMEELIRGAKLFVVIGYGGREPGIMNFLISAGKRWPDTQIYWVQHSNKAEELEPLAKQFLQTSRRGKTVLGQDADAFFMRLCQLLGIGAPRSIVDPIAHLRSISDQIVTSENADIRNLLTEQAALLSDFEYFYSLKKSKALNVPDVIARASEYRLAGRFEDELSLLSSALEATGDQSIRERLRELISVEAATRLNLATDAPLPSAVVDEGGKVITHNKLFTDFVGQFKSTTSEPNILDIIQPDDLPKFREVFQGAQYGRSGSDWVDVGLGISEQQVRFYFKPVDSERKDLRCHVYIVDMTTQRKLENELVQSQRMQAVGQLAGGIANDFSNILSAIMMATDFLLNSHKPTDAAFQDIVQIKQNVNRGVSLVRQLLAFTRRQIVRPQIVAVSDALSDIAVLLRRLVGPSVELTMSSGQDLWPVRVDLSQFEQVIVNVIVNARDAIMAEGRIAISADNVQVGELELAQVPAGDYVRLSIADNGVGIPASVIGKVFEPFFSTKDRSRGTGLGLSVAQGIVRQSGGYIFVESEASIGTIFSIYFPRFLPELKPIRPISPDLNDLSMAQSSDQTGSERILLVEDDHSLRQLNARGLRSRGYDVIEASNGEEALSLFEDDPQRVDLIISDVVMPKMDGPTLLRTIRDKQYDVKIIFVSGYAEDAFENSLPANEQFSFLPKPFTLSQLVAAAKEVMGTNRK